MVEDDPQVTAAWTGLLQAWQMDARFVSCATRYFVRTAFAPGEGGFEILRSLQQRFPAASGAMVNGEFNSPELVRAESDGYQVLRKPLEVSDLHGVLARRFGA
jgi:hypothetical protein